MASHFVEWVSVQVTQEIATACTKKLSQETIEPTEYLSTLSRHAAQLIEALGAFALAESGFA